MLVDATVAKKQPDIALFVPSLEGGLGKVTISLANAFSESGLLVDMWSLKKPAVTIAINSNVHVHYLESKRALFSLPELATLLRNRRPKILLSASYHTNCVAVVARSLSRVKTNLTLVEHTSLTTGLHALPPLKRLVAKLSIAILYRKADNLIAVSKDAAAEVAELAGIPSTKVVPIYNPIVTEKMYRDSNQTISHPFLSGNVPILLSIGRLSNEKDYPTLLLALTKVLQHEPVKLVIIGEGPERASLEALIQKWNLTNDVDLLGHVDNPYPWYRYAELLVLSSTREGLPTVLIEALALGTKIVSTDARTGPREILQNGKLGTLVPTSNPDALAEAIRQTLHTPKAPVTKNILKPYTTENAIASYRKVLDLP